MLNFQYFLENHGVIILATLAFSLIVLSIWNATIQMQLSRLKQNNKELFAGTKIKNLEELLLNQTRTIKVLDKDIQELYNISNQINALALRGLHKTAIVRFNPFKDIGGNQSFSIAFLNGKNNGLTLSSLFTREGARIYSKSIVAGQSEKYPLTEEEKEAIEIAMKTETKK